VREGVPSDALLLELEPWTADRIAQLLQLGRDRGWPVRISTPYGARRNASMQADLYAKGRREVAGGAWQVVDRSQIVTNALDPRDTPHGRGMAADLVFTDSRGRQSWASSWPWRELGELGQSLGLRWGGSFSRASGLSGDLGHFERPDWRAAVLS
jgi:hypothetical protein